jgi:thiamine-monophosphate kinase
MPRKKKITTISELGEFRLIDQLTGPIKPKQKSTVKGIGDDAAVIDHGKDKMVLTTDLLLEGIHFNLVYHPLKHLGYKAVVVNLSDVYAMNAVPAQVTVSIGLSNKFSVQALEQLYDGIKLACERYEVDLVGGDTSSSITGMLISVTAVGYAPEDKLVYRDGAGKNDLICVSGNLGAAYLGLQILERERKIYESDSSIQPELENYSYLIERQLKPEARKDITDAFRQKGIQPTAMIDISDGLSSDLLHICKQSGVGCRIFQERIPIDPEADRTAHELNLEPVICALNGGEDYELLFTFPVERMDKVDTMQGISVVGHTVDQKEGCRWVTANGNEIELKATGWDALDQPMST